MCSVHSLCQCGCARIQEIVSAVLLLARAFDKRREGGKEGSAASPTRLHWVSPSPWAVPVGWEAGPTLSQPPTPSYSCRLRNRLHTEPPPPSCTCRLRSRCPCTPGASHTPCWGTDLNTHSSHASGSWGLARSSPQWLCSGNEQKREDTETCQISV